MFTRKFSDCVCGLMTGRRTPGVRAFAILLLSLSFLAGESRYHTHLAAQPIGVYADYWSGTTRDGSASLVKFHLQIAAASLVFTRADDGTSLSVYDVDAIIYDGAGVQLAERIVERQFQVGSYAETKTYTTSHLSELRFSGFTPGSYRARFVITDRNSSKRIEIHLPFRVAQNDPGAQSLSDILMSRRVSVRQEASPGEEQTAILNYPERVYGVNTAELYYYFELYSDGAPGDSITYHVACEASGAEIRPLATRTIRKHGRRTVVFSSVDVSDLPGGKYTLSVAVVEAEQSAALVQRKDFYVHQSPIDIRFRSYADILAEIRLIGGEDELRELQRAPHSQRQDLLNLFWQQRDPTPSTLQNEQMAEFYRRIDLARAQFQQEDPMAGRISDREKVFIIYGAPDRVTRQRDTIDHARVEIWHYSDFAFSAIFRDDLGFGSYHLVEPGNLFR